MPKRLVLVLLCICLSVTSLVASVLPSAAQLEPLINRVKGAVVIVEVRRVLGGKARGSGFIYDPAGYVLTNHHVIEGATDITVTLPDKRSYNAKVVDYIRREEFQSRELENVVDAAVLKINAGDLPALPMGNSDILRQGQELIVLGYPGGVGTDEVSVTRGIVSAVRTGWVQTDALIEHGNSGGPVIDREGRVVGLATFLIGPSSRIGGVVAINGIRSMAQWASDPGAQRYHELKVTGMEYQWPVAQGKRKTWRQTYSPGNTRNQARVQEWSTEITSVENYNGATVYQARTSDGSENKSYVGADGTMIISQWSSSWSYSNPEPIPVLLFPPVIGRSWQETSASENASQGIRRRRTLLATVENMDEVITVPAGTFSHVIKIARSGRELQVRGSQSFTFTLALSQWVAPGVGAVRNTLETRETGERYEDELVSY